MFNRLFLKTLLFFSSTLFLYSCGSRIVPESNFLEKSEVMPSKLSYDRDSIRFQVKGEIPIESVLSPKNPKVELVFRGSDSSINLGELQLNKKVAFCRLNFIDT